MSLSANTLNPLKFPSEMGKLFKKIREVEKFDDEPDPLATLRVKGFNRWSRLVSIVTYLLTL